MSDRPAPPSSPPPSAPPTGSQAAAPAGPPTSSAAGEPIARTPRTPRAPKAPRPQKPASQPGSAGGDTVATPVSRGATAPAADSTAERSGFAQRIQAKLSSTSDESRPDAAAPATGPAPKGKPRGPRRARLRLTRIDPWSVMKTAFLLSIAIGIVTVVAVAMIWEVIGAAGVWNSINDTVKEVVDEPGTADFDIRDYVGTDRVLGFTMLVAAVDVVLITAIATLGAFLYNMSAALLGGIEVTLAEDN